MTTVIELAISQMKNAKHLWIVWRDNSKCQETLKVKIAARKYKRCLIIPEKKRYKFFPLFVPYLMTAALLLEILRTSLVQLQGIFRSLVQTITGTVFSFF